MYKRYLHYLVLVIISYGPMAGAESNLVLSLNTQADVHAEADIAVLSANLQVQGLHVDKLLRKAESQLATLLQALAKHGLSEQQLQAGQLRLQQRWQHQQGRRLTDGYELHRPLQIRSSIEAYPELLKLLVDHGVNHITGPQFDFSQRQQLEDRAVALAHSRALERASLLAQQAGAKDCQLLEAELAPLHSPSPMLRASSAEIGAYQPGLQTVRQSIRARFTCRYP